MNQGENLLRPTLGGVGAAGVSIYSATVGYVTAFFGGPIAAAIVFLVNSRRLRRLSRDWPFAVLALAGEAAFLHWQLSGANWQGEPLDASALRLLQRLLGLAFFGVAYAMHRTFYRNMTVAGIAPPSGWLFGIGAIMAGAAVHVGMRTWMAS